MDADVKRRLFEPFVTTKGEGRGTGLGLSIVYGIVRQAGGHIAVESESADGTSITIHLPRAAAPSRAASPARAAAPRGRESVLVVEDSPPLREAIARGLEEVGYRVSSAGSGPEALELASRHEGEFEVLVTDVVMPRMRGEELARRLVARWPKLRVLFVSGFAGGADESPRPLEGAFLQKPFSIAVLATKLRDLIVATVP
jgi:CheY-like chemotaxis protein